ncbi:mechanosensitive ion channel family protein [Baaleninema sp.]|uniref:mechanosensitive ion channel family protein n=1 Tax=Baaleninema sp. TaxID=3101197 RepID=UPI003D041D49
MNNFLRFIRDGAEFPDTLQLGTALLLAVVIFLFFLLLAGISYLQLSKLSDALIRKATSTEYGKIYQNVIEPDRQKIIALVILALADNAILAASLPAWVRVFEVPLGLLIAGGTIFVGFKAFDRFFEDYLLGISLEDESKINTELLALAKFLSKAVIVLTTIFFFAQTHRVDLVGLVASLGIGGIAVAFASQKVLEQILWSVVLYIDRPFDVDDYIHLPDGTLGRVESIGWRSTKVRLSGKNTLVIAPNSNLAQVNIENLTLARRIISMVNLTFFRAMTNEEKALIRQLILSSTSDILGIDHQLTKVDFQDRVEPDGDRMQVQAKVTFFILGASENSVELRKNLLELAREKIILQLYEYGVKFKFEVETLDIAQPMNI